MTKYAYEHLFRKMESSLEDMYRFDPFSQNLIRGIHQLKKTEVDLDLVCDINHAFHDVGLIKKWVRHTLSDFNTHQRKRIPTKINTLKEGINPVRFSKYLEQKLKEQHEKVI